MGSPGKVTILLADEDALRRDGLSAVLSGNSAFEVISGVADGEAALVEIRAQRPQVAVIDLNLPRIHGIELIRRIRAESLPTKIVVMAGTTDDEIVREVVRAGADGYLLKNGPSRHLMDAISYVRDGGQYFSPQLGRDGRDRHLLEEPARVAPPPPPPVPESRPRAARPQEEDPYEEEDEPAEIREAPPRSRQPRPARRNDPASFRQRLRDEAPTQNLNDRDYEIMSLMADGIRPILDRLEEIDSRVALMETGDAELPGDPRAWLSSELVHTMGGRRGRDYGVVGRTVDDLEARLPHLIEEAVTKRFNSMAGKLQQEIEETHVRTMEAFVKNIQVKLVQRVTALEHDMGRQAEAMNQLREYSQRTEENLGRLISGVDRLAQDLPRRLAAAKPVPDAPPEDSSDEILKPLPRAVKRKKVGGGFAFSGRSVKLGGAAIIGLLVLAGIGWGILRLIEGPADPAATEASGAAATPGKTAKEVIEPGMVDTKTKMQAALDAMEHKDYAVAEDVFRNVLKSEPNNVDAIKGLASVLFRQDKTDEAAAILDKLPKD